MKYGNFVGQKTIMFSDGELESIAERLKSQIEYYFGIGSVSSCETERDEISGFFSGRIRMKLSKPFNGRNLYRETVRNADTISFFLTKESGFLETKSLDENGNMTIGRDYENAPEFSYGCQMSISGCARGYRCRTWQMMCHWSPYVYGTEADDLTYEAEDMRKLRASITERR